MERAIKVFDNICGHCGHDYDGEFCPFCAKARATSSDAIVIAASADLFERELFALVNSHAKAGLGKPELVRKLKWVLGSAEMS